MEEKNGRQKEELFTEFKTLNDREKDYILGLTRALSSAVKNMVLVSNIRTKSGKKRNCRI